MTDHHAHATRLLARAEQANYQGFHAQNLIAAAQAHLTLAQTDPRGSASGPDQNAALRRIIAAHIHATLTTATGPIRKVLTDRVIRPLVAALDDAGIDLTAELTAIGVNLPAQRDGADG